MIRRLVRQMLTAQIVSAFAVSVCLLVDGIVIGRFLKEEAMAAFSLANPLLLTIGAIGTLLAAGVQVVCGKSLGTGSQKETNEGYSSALAVSGGISILFTAAVLLLAPFFASVLGAGKSGALFNHTKGYLAGFSIGAPGSMGALVLVPFLQMAGQSNLLTVAVVSMTVADIALDLLNVFVFHGGMFGMGLASAASYYVAMGVVSVYFLSKRCVFRFSPRQISIRKIGELFYNGIPAGFSMASAVVMSFLINRILKSTGGSNALAAFSVITAIGNAANCVSTGIGGVSLTLAGIFYHEEDRGILCLLLRLLSRYAVMLGLAVGVLLFTAAHPLVSLFIPAGGEAHRLAVLGLRIFGAGIIPCCLNNALKSAYQATKRVKLTETISVLEGAVFPVLAAFLFSRFMGTAGAWLYFPAGEWTALLFIGLYAALRTGNLPWKEGRILLLKKDFGVSPDRLLEVNIHSMEEVAEAAKKSVEFCRHHQLSPRISNHIALCIEEMAGNTIQHGFTMDRKHHDLSVRLLRKKGYCILRFRDDCGAFDPVHYIPEGDEDALGIRLMLAFAQDVRYTYALNMNNLCIRISDQGR